MIRSFELGVLFLPSRLQGAEFTRSFSCTPAHPLLGYNSVIPRGPITGFRAVDATQAR
jgi:hypothetical protein